MHSWQHFQPVMCVGMESHEASALIAATVKSKQALTGSRKMCMCLWCWGITESSL